MIKHRKVIRDTYVKPSFKLPLATYHVLFLGVCLVIAGVIMAVFGYYAPLLRFPTLSVLKPGSPKGTPSAPSSNSSSTDTEESETSVSDINPPSETVRESGGDIHKTIPIIPDTNQMAHGRKPPKSHFSSLKDKYAAAIESNAAASNKDGKERSSWLDWYELRLTIFSYAGPCFMGLGCIILVVVYVIAFEARDRARHSSVILLKDVSIQSHQIPVSDTTKSRIDRDNHFPYIPGRALKGCTNYYCPSRAHSGRLSANLSDPELYGQSLVSFEKYPAKLGIPSIVIGSSSMMSGSSDIATSGSHFFDPSSVATCSSKFVEDTVSLVDNNYTRPKFY